ncbi:MAG: hypothetical protein ACKKMW_02290 [Candidatus Nealsonbacteria bacterium]
MLIFKERHIVNKLHRLIWKEKRGLINQYRYRTKGVSLKEFSDWLWQKEFFPTKSKFSLRIINFKILVVKIFDKDYLSNLRYRNEEIIRHCLSDKYIKRDTSESFPLTDNTLLTIEPKGERLRELLGFIEALLRENSKLSVFLLGVLGGLLLQLFLNYFNIKI